MLESELVHLVLSLVVGWVVYRIYRSYNAFLYALVGGLLVDIDHLIDYLIYKGSIAQLSLVEFLAGRYFLYSGKLYIFLHSFEIVILLVLASILVMRVRRKSHPSAVLPSALVAIALALCLHLGFDIVHNRVQWSAYSIAYRASQYFDIHLLTQRP